MFFKVLLIVILVLIALVMVRMMFLRRERGRELFVTEATGRTRPRVETTKPRTGIDSSPLELEVIRLLEQRKKIQAIKVVREHTRLGLKEAKDLVEDVERTGRLTLPPLPTAPYLDDVDVMDRARELKRDGKAIEAIKLIRQHSKLGLKEAKDLYDRL
jgi:ribosomal protein L7/L12